MGIEESALVVGVHAVSLFGFTYAACSWRDWIRRQYRELLKSSIGLLLLACVCFSAALGFAAVWYGLDRALDPLGVHLRVDGYAVLLAVVRLMVPMGILLMMIARWRLDERSPEEVKRCTLIAVAVGAGIYAATVGVLW